jgi:hypothetical protein
MSQQTTTTTESPFPFPGTTERSYCAFSLKTHAALVAANAGAATPDAARAPTGLPAVGMARALAVRRAWRTQTVPGKITPSAFEPEPDELDDALDQQIPFEEPVALPMLMVLLTELWEEEGLV